MAGFTTSIDQLKKAFENGFSLHPRQHYYMERVAEATSALKKALEV